MKAACFRICLILNLVLITNACRGKNEEVNVPSLGEHFPQLINTPSVFLDSPPIEGELVLEDGCLRVKNVTNLAMGDNLLLIWDPRFSTITEQGIVHVVDSNTGTILASVGDHVAIAEGGPITGPTKKPIPDECSEPYWVVGEFIKKIDRNSLSKDAHFPQLATPIGNVDFLVRGQLTLENDCLRVSKANLATGDSFLLIWEKNFAVRREQGVVQVIDADTGQVLASVGDYVEIGGGKAPWGIKDYLREPIPAECPGPYWLVHETLKRIDYP